MRKSYFGSLAVLFIVLAFVVTGCAKKAEPPKPAEEIKAPVAAPAPAPAPEKPKEEVKILTQAPMTSLDDEIKALQEKNIYFDFDKPNTPFPINWFYNPFFEEKIIKETKDKIERSVNNARLD